MECPYCNKEMEEGFIPASRMRNQWIKKGGKMPSTVFGTSKDGFALSEMPVWKTKKTISYYCYNCNIVIIPVKKFN
ncbi:PF20097 family protein [Haploplasma axanthum]|uniref:DUF6487 domain-containing protein n=1 Tax=Haploplasma axanthum TaxID=29552 RepID=A0A449BFS8_HAPAX|nr:PF20097 family protein [Haploplasma axanthum]VEU81265.1 Uncharacterised protein [Haploplasma axanthum]